MPWCWSRTRIRIVQFILLPQEASFNFSNKLPRQVEEHNVIKIKNQHQQANLLRLVPGGRTKLNFTRIASRFHSQCLIPHPGYDAHFMPNFSRGMLLQGQQLKRNNNTKHGCRNLHSPTHGNEKDEFRLYCVSFSVVSIWEPRFTKDGKFPATFKATRCREWRPGRELTRGSFLCRACSVKAGGMNDIF